MKLIEDKRFYVYIYLDPRKNGVYKYSIDNKNFIFYNEPFYIGKGLSKRLYEHIFEANRAKIKNLKHIKILEILDLKLYPIIIKLIENISDIEACIFEKKLINIIGKVNDNKGPLCNIIKGGSGGTSKYISKENNWREKIKEYYSIGENRKRAGYYNTKEYFINKYGIEEGNIRYYLRIERIKNSTLETYKDPKIRNKCKNFGSKNGFYGKKSKSAIKVEINGIVFDSKFEASLKLKIPYTTLDQRLKAKKPGYKIIK